MMRFFHWFKHLFGWNTGNIYSWWDDSDGTKRLMIGFKCNGCDCITGVHYSGIHGDDNG